MTAQSSPQVFYPSRSQVASLAGALRRYVSADPPLAPPQPPRPQVRDLFAACESTDGAHTWGPRFPDADGGECMQCTVCGLVTWAPTDATVGAQVCGLTSGIGADVLCPGGAR